MNGRLARRADSLDSDCSGGDSSVIMVQGKQNVSFISNIFSKKKVIFPVALLSILCLYLWGYAPYLLKPSEMIAARAVFTRPIVPDTNDRCRQWDDTHLLCLPNVFLLGASKAGTSSLFNYIMRHPQVAKVKRRQNGNHDTSNEVHRFDSPWFHFYPMKISRAMEWAAAPIVHTANTSVIHYTPQYIYAPSVPYDVRKFYPHPKDLKFIVVLRNPVDRALSSYWFKNSKRFTNDRTDKGSVRGFMKNFRSEKRRRKIYEECIADNYLYTEYRHASLLTRKELSSNFDSLQKCFGADFRNPKLGLRHIDKGIYKDQIDRWLQNFYKRQFLFIMYDDFSSNPLKVYQDIIEFMGQPLIGTGGFRTLDDIELFIHKTYGVVRNSRRQDISSAQRMEVECFYQPYNKQLAEILGRKEIFNSSSAFTCTNS